MVWVTLHTLAPTTKREVEQTLWNVVGRALVAVLGVVKHVSGGGADTDSTVGRSKIGPITSQW